MLKILKERCLYLNERGSTLNNPHIPKGFLEKYKNITLNLSNMSKTQLKDITQKRLEEIREDLK
jgi:hypothetical protein